MKKFHAELYMPEVALKLQFAALLRYTKHAIKAASDDRYGKIELPKVFDTRNASLIEAVVKDGKVVKSLWRQAYDQLHDLCLVLDPSTATVITAWLNLKTDRHSTLDEAKYDMEE